MRPTQRIGQVDPFVQHSVHLVEVGPLPVFSRVFGNGLPLLRGVFGRFLPTLPLPPWAKAPPHRVLEMRVDVLLRKGHWLLLYSSDVLPGPGVDLNDVPFIDEGRDLELKAGLCSDRLGICSRCISLDPGIGAGHF